jgi:hypothetical protein
MRAYIWCLARLRPAVAHGIEDNAGRRREFMGMDVAVHSRLSALEKQEAQRRKGKGRTTSEKLGRKHAPLFFSRRHGRRLMVSGATTYEINYVLFKKRRTFLKDSILEDLGFDA